MLSNLIEEHYCAKEIRPRSSAGSQYEVIFYWISNLEYLRILIAKFHWKKTREFKTKSQETQREELSKTESQMVLTQRMIWTEKINVAWICARILTESHVLLRKTMLKLHVQECRHDDQLCYGVHPPAAHGHGELLGWSIHWSGEKNI